ncbi:MAG TPA: DUF899 domain-containing protein [Actinomycetota bacterium]|nr:DUF899 domain-containing protein [Actinomycetota bacterium]
MTRHTVGTREEWRTARLALLEAEKELTHRSDEVARQRQQLPWVRIDKDYRFDTQEGEASLRDLFRGRSQLIVHHFMFSPNWTEGCPSCSSVADGYDGFRVHLEHHDVALTAVSRAPIEVLTAYRRRMGWSFPWASSAGSDFNFDFGVSYTEERLAHGAEHNYRRVEVDPRSLPGGGQGVEPVDAAESPGVSAFALDDGVVYHTYSAYSRGTDVLWGMYQWLDRAPLGRNESGPWFRRHDEYGKG